VGNQPHVEVVVGTNRELNFEKVHQLTEKIEQSISKELGTSTQVIVHAEPTPATGEPYSVTVRAIADRLGLRIHNLHVYLVEQEIWLEMDLEISSHLKLADAHRESEELEQALIKEFQTPVRVRVHLEPLNEKAHTAKRDTILKEDIRKTLAGIDHNAVLDEVLQTSTGLVLTLTLPLQDEISLSAAHAIMSDLERKIRSKVNDVVKVHVDPEPLSKFNN
jgi:divalent metal cation (Fe/Co/Zn/Cd) transporter